MKLLTDAYITNNGTYEALGWDEQGNQCKFIWDIIADDLDSIDDESEMCDWDNPTEIIKL